MTVEAVTLVTLANIQAAQARLSGWMRPTPLIPFPNENLWLKAENLHPTGAFKLRGAFNKLLSLTPEQRARGVVAHSSGNHAGAVAYAARALGIGAVAVMPSGAPQTKLAATRACGAEVVLVGNASEERATKAKELAGARGLTPVPPYDDAWIIAGAGTTGPGNPGGLAGRGHGAGARQRRRPDFGGSRCHQGAAPGCARDRRGT